MKRFILPRIPQSTSKTIRFPNDILEEIERYLCGKDSTFSAFVIASVRYALKNLPEEQTDE